MNKVTIYRYDENKPMRTLNLNGEPWFVLRDVCEVLGLGNSRMVADRLDEDEKGVSQIDTLGGVQNATIISESGLYNVILRSDKPEALPQVGHGCGAAQHPQERRLHCRAGGAFPAGAYGKGPAGRAEDPD